MEQTEVCLLFQLFSCYCFSSTICLSINPNWENTNTRSIWNASFFPCNLSILKKPLLCTDWCHYKLILQNKMYISIVKKYPIVLFLISFSSTIQIGYLKKTNKTNHNLFFFSKLSNSRICPSLLVNNFTFNLQRK